MKLLIHDFSESEWQARAKDYQNYEIISDNGTISPCVGCFGCWVKTPCRCVIKDGYDNMGELIHRAEEVVIMSRYTYGGFSSFVKNVLDRSIGYILPFFRIYKGEMHHKPRYPEVKPMSFVIRGHELSDTEKERTTKYIEAVCKNFNGLIKEIRFEECDENINSDCKNKKNVRDISKEKNEDIISNEINEDIKGQKTLFINCSMRGTNSNSGRFLEVISSNLKEEAENNNLSSNQNEEAESNNNSSNKNEEVESINLSSYLNNLDVIAKIIEPSNKVVLGMPLYVDGIPSAALRLMEYLEKMKSGSGRKLYVIANMGFYESKQIENLLGMVEDFCSKSGFEYCGGIAIGAGEMMGQVLGFGANGPGKHVYQSLLNVGSMISNGQKFENIYTKTNKFPRFLYFAAANSGMLRSGKNNGLSKKDMLQGI